MPTHFFQSGEGGGGGGAGMQTVQTNQTAPDIYIYFFVS